MSQSQRTDKWFQAFGAPHGRGPRLLCLPHAGGSSSFYRPLAIPIGDAAEVFAVQYPGRQERRFEPPLTDLRELARLIHAELGPWNDRPLVLFGHSMGAVIAYEIARRLENDGAPPLGLIVSGRRAPSIAGGENVHQRGDQAILAELRHLSGTAAALLDDEGVVQMILPSLRADYRAIETYRHRPGTEPTCPITVLTGDADPRAPLAEVRAWSRHTTGAFDLRTFPGGHFYLTAQWPAVATAVREAVGEFTTPVSLG
ncbi:thioesterase II family protein [Actinoplanes sp. G11-F43]|uniref:thioesterase II family protein n=1 Tax=Actinoplanes sp. G11-F43 TaxID=3424130 RepID=UPI003D349EA0